jgi:membrane carboxypeptidase/penicillin-binding protein
MMRSVLNEGTGAGARANGFAADAAGKSGTTNDLRDAWFVGFTPELLTVVWVGLDDNQPLGLSGAQAALPIWTSVHEKRRGRPRRRDVRGATGRQLHRDRSRHRQDRDTNLPTTDHRGIPLGDRAAWRL